MFELLSFGSVVLFFVGLLVVSFRWFRRGSPDKLTNVSSSCESECTPEQYAKQESYGKQTKLGGKPNGGNSFGHKNEGAQGIKNNVGESNESLRQRLSARKPEHDQDAGEDAKTNVTNPTIDYKQTIESNASNELSNNSPEPEKESSKTYEKNVNEPLPVRASKEVTAETGIKIISKTNNEEILNKPSGKRSIFDALESNHGNEEPILFVEKKVVQDDVADSLAAKNKTQEESNINHDVLVNECSNGETNAFKKAIIKQDVLIEEEIKVNVLFTEAAVEVEEESSLNIKECEDDSIKEEANIAGALSNDVNSEVVANGPTKSLGIEKDNTSEAEHVRVEQIDVSMQANVEIGQINDLVTENVCVEQINRSVQERASIEEIHNSVQENDVELRDENVNANFMLDIAEISDEHADEVGPVIDNVIEQFSDRLSKCILDTVLQDTQMFYGQSEDENYENHSKESVLKFADILAESIVRSVVDYSRVSQGHIVEHEELDHLSPNVAYVSNKTNENANHDVPYESSLPHDEDIFSADEANDDSSCCRDIHDYAKRLSQQIMSDVLDLHGQNGESRSSTEVYASRLTESVLLSAIHGANSQIVDNHSLPDSDMGIESALDLFISEIVGNAVESAISKVAQETHRDTEEQNVNKWDLEGQLEMGEDIYDPWGHVENHMDESEVHLVTNGEIDSPNEEIDNEQNEPSSSNGPNAVQQNGKLQSKWLSEDDLDELYDDELSDEESDIVAEQSSTSARNAMDDGKTVTSPNNLITPNTQKEFWRKSLIEDLDDEMDFDDEIETPRSSLSSSPTKSANFEDFIVDGSVDSEDEVVETSANVKVQAPIITASDSSRSRLRSVDTTPVLVLDNGSAFLKAGFSDQPLPREIVSSVVGTPLRYSQDISGMDYSAKPGLVFGSSAMSKAGVLHIEYPLKADLVEKWSDVEGLWHYVLGSLMSIQDNPDFPVLISQPALNPKKNTEKIAEIMFEHFHMPSLFIADQPALSLFSMGYTSGLSFCSGFNSTQAGVVYEGHVLPHTVKQLDIAGYQLTENLKKLLMSLQGFGFRSSSQWQIVDEIKKKLGYVSLDFESDSKRYKTQAELHTPYELPDGQIIEVGLERFGCAESLFRPMELGLTQSPPHMLIIEAINSCEEELQELCYKAMGVSGGTTQMTGFTDRLDLELRKHDRKFKNFTAPEHRDVSTWLGGAVVASLPTFREMVVSVDEYAEAGARVVHSKCF